MSSLPSPSSFPKTALDFGSGVRGRYLQFFPLIQTRRMYVAYRHAPLEVSSLVVSREKKKERRLPWEPGPLSLAWIGQFSSGVYGSHPPALECLFFRKRSQALSRGSVFSSCSSSFIFCRDGAMFLPFFLSSRMDRRTRKRRRRRDGRWQRGTTLAFSAILQRTEKTTNRKMLFSFSSPLLTGRRKKNKEGDSC